jgi:hypothetical protein
VPSASFWRPLARPPPACQNAPAPLLRAPWPHAPCMRLAEPHAASAFEPRQVLGERVPLREVLVCIRLGLCLGSRSSMPSSPSVIDRASGHGSLALLAEVARSMLLPRVTSRRGVSIQYSVLIRRWTGSALCLRANSILPPHPSPKGRLALRPLAQTAPIIRRHHGN